MVLRRAQDSSAGTSRSLGSRWLGPSRVTQKSSPVTFVVKDLVPPCKEHKVHINQIKNFYVEDELSILSDGQDNSSLLYDDSSLSSPLLSYVNNSSVHPMKSRSQV